MSRTFLLQDWITIRSSLTQPFVQDPAQWLDLDGFADVTCWIDIAEVTQAFGGGPSPIVVQLQTSPSCDDAYFVPLAPPVLVGNAAPFIQPSTVPIIVRSAQSTTSNNLMRFLRWSIAPSATGTWDITFRIRTVASRSTTFVPTLIPGCVLWFRPDFGIGFSSGASVNTWADQSGIADSARSLVAGTNKPTFSVADASYNNQPTLQFASASNQYFTSAGIWGQVLTQPLTLIFVGHRNSPTVQNFIIDGDSGGTGGSVFATTTGGVTLNLGALLTETGAAWTLPSVLMAEGNGMNSALYALNSVTKVSISGPGGSNGYNSITLASGSIFFGGGSTWDGTIAEVIAYAGLLSQSSKTQLRSYFNGRYGLNVT